MEVEIKGYKFKLDEEIVEYIKGKKYYPIKVGERVYLIRNISRKDNIKQKLLYLHKEILGSNGRVDFVDKDCFNLQKSNLKVKDSPVKLVKDLEYKLKKLVEDNSLEEVMEVLKKLV